MAAQNETYRKPKNKIKYISGRQKPYLSNQRKSYPQIFLLRTTYISKKLWIQYRHLNLNKCPILFQFCTRCHKRRLDTKEAKSKIWVVALDIPRVLICSHKKTTWTQVKYTSNF